MPRAADGIAARLRGRGHLAGLDEPHPRRAVGGGEKAAESTRRRGPCGGRSPAAACATGSRGRTRRARPARRPARALPAGRPGLASAAVTVAAADDVVDAVFVAVDGEGVAGGQRAALAANFGKLGLVEDHAGGPAGARVRRPARASACRRRRRRRRRDRRSCPRVHRRPR